MNPSVPHNWKTQYDPWLVWLKNHYESFCNMVMSGDRAADAPITYEGQEAVFSETYVFLAFSID